MQAAPSRTFALASSGKIYVLSSDLQEESEGQYGASSWNPLSWSSIDTKKGYVELEADQKLAWGEK